MLHDFLHPALSALVEVVSVGARCDGMRLVLAEVASLDVAEPVQRVDRCRVRLAYFGRRRKRILTPYSFRSSSCVS